MSEDLELALLCDVLQQGGSSHMVRLFNRVYQQNKSYFRSVIESGGPGRFVESCCKFLRLEEREDSQVVVHVPFVVCREKQCTCNNLHVCLHWPSRIAKCMVCKTELLKNKSNGAVFRLYPLLKRLSPSHLKLLLKHSKFLIRPPTPIFFEKCVSPADLFPDVCRYYNSEMGCIKPSCVFFHLCSLFVGGTCKQQGCALSHDFQSAHNQNIVKKCGGIPMSPASIVRVMKSQTSITQLALEMIENDELIHDSDTEICIWNLVGKCEYGAGCAFHHVNLPFWWQYQTEENTWQSWDRDSILILEKAFCNPVIKTVEIKINDIIVIIDFPTMTFLDGDKQVRRISTGAVHGARHLGSLATAYHWYWEEINNVWHEFPSCVTQGKHCPQLELPSHVIERAFLAGSQQLSFKISDSDFVLLFGGMHMKERGCTNIRKICRRPIYRSVPRCMGQVKSKDSANHQYFTQISDVSKDSDEWKSVVTRLMGTNVPVEIKRISSKLIDEQFKNGQKDKEIKYLYHPLKSADHLRAIAQHGLLPSDTPVAMKKYGQSLHLSRDENYSLHFSACRSVLLAEVAIGTFCRGKVEDTEPPQYGQHFNCCVNEINNPDVYVVYDAKCVKSKYCIKF